jgi:hypothetical protein
MNWILLFRLLQDAVLSDEYFVSRKLRRAHDSVCSAGLQLCTPLHIMMPVVSMLLSVAAKPPEHM